MTINCPIFNLVFDMLVLELFAGSCTLSKTFRERGHTAITVDWNKDLVGIDYNIDISNITKEDIIKMCGRVPDVIWASPDCTTYSIMSINRHRQKVTGILDPTIGYRDNLDPISDYAKKCDICNINLIKVLKDLNCLYFIENPRAGLRKMYFMKDLPRYTVTYCQYGFEYMKPTDIWTNHPNPKFKPPCKKGDRCHISSPRGSQKGLSAVGTKFERAILPKQLCEHIVDICEEVICQ